ncbi:MinD/ParA family ATP-binding protein [Mycolicibacterium mageritense]|uniref:MinD/ParA family ATP-binding protein n=1 Tax=Mycolicibacterium mageritense TaxID=53462 RepID=UPI0011D93540|nr:MinD/ParA family protein [Mycolicibacterium mageritense]TXI55750.1 MAG: hypothetical protein E6Q55_30540 [Mycolicibacterium mageritense]
MSDNRGTNNHEIGSTPPRYGDNTFRAETSSSPSTDPERSRPSAPVPPPEQSPTTPDTYDDATRPVSPDLVASVLADLQAGQPQAPTAGERDYAPLPPPPPSPPPRSWPGPDAGARHSQYPQQGYPQGPQAHYPQHPAEGTWRPGRQDMDRFPEPAAARAPEQGSASLIDRLSPEVLAPPPKPRPSKGWRRAVLWMTAGLINPGLSAAEETRLSQEATIVSRLSGDCYRIGVLVGKGGTGKTTVATLVSSILAEYRSDDRVVAVDADPSFGKLANRVAPSLSQTYWELLNDEATGQLRRWTDVKASLGSNPHSGLWLLRGEHRSKRRRLIDAQTYKSAMEILDRYMTIAVIDCGQVLEHPLMDEVLSGLDAAIVVGALEQGAGQAAAQTLAWLEDRGYHRLLTNGVVVLNDPRGRASKRDRKQMFRDFQSHVDAATVLLPFDEHLSEGMVIDPKKGISRETRSAVIEITAHIARGFAATTLDGQRR